MVGYFLLLLLITLAHSYPGCVHDKIIRNQKLIPINDSVTSSRRLQISQYGPIRFYFHYNTTQVDTTTTLGQNIVKMMNILQIFWQNTIEVYYATSLSFNVANGVDPTTVQCLDFTVPQTIIKNPVVNADYGIFVQAANDSDSGITAYSYPCAYSQTTQQPMWGLLHWNINYFTFDLLSFQMNIKIGIHESTHLLGLSSILYQNFVHGKLVNASQNSYINGTYIQKALKDQYGCTSSPGMLLQSGGGQGTSMSHWSYKAAYNEYMTAGVLISNPTISYITLALLQETGWYKSIFKTYGQFINWGYQKGCSVLDPNNCTSNEYCNTVNVKGCDYDQTSLGYCKNQSLTNCLFVKFYVNYMCEDPNFSTKSLNSLVVNVTGQAGGQYSRCFSSNLVLQGQPQTKYPFRCYSTICSTSGRTLTVQIGNKYALCMFPGQNITVPGYAGFLTCPTSFSRVCAIKRCPNECNANGVCVNGKCLCSSSYTGDSCSQVTSIGMASQDTQTTFIATQNNNCMIGTYLSEFGECEPCTIYCAVCTQQECIMCLGQNLPLPNGTCPNPTPKAN